MSTRSFCLKVASFCALALAPSGTHAEPPPKDYQDLPLEALGVKLAESKKDPKTGFVVAGQNATALVKKLTHINSVPVLELEKGLKNFWVRYLDDEQSLLTVLAADNQYIVAEMGLTHQELAKHLHILGAIRMRRKVEELTYHGKRFKVVHEVTWTLPASSPFNDGTKESDTLLTVHNLDNGKKLSFYRLMPHMVERYGFYAGKSRYRVEPQQVIEVLDFIKVDKKK